MVLGAPLFSAPAPAEAAPSAPAGYRHGAVPTVAAAAAKAKVATSGNNLLYGGGTSGVGVTTGPPQVYLVFWGSQWGSPATNGQGYLTLSGDSAGMAPDLQGFLKGLGTGGETWSGVMTQYCEAIATGAQACPAGAAHVGYPTGGALAGVWADTAAAAPSSPTGHQLAQEAITAANHFGRTTQAANRNIQYFVVSPSGTTPDGFNTPSGQFCAWHDFTADPTLPGGGAAISPFAVAFTNMPYVTDAGGTCGKNFVNPGTGGTLDGVTIVGGHEYAETITDQFPIGGWLDAVQNENGDKCAWVGSGPGASQNIALTTGSFAVQTTWANDANSGSGGCLVAHPIVVNSASAAPVITSAASVTFTVGVPGALTIGAGGSPPVTVTESGPLPTGVTFNNGTRSLSGTPAQATAASYPVTFTAANGVGPDAVQNFTLTVSQATLSNPVDGQTNVDTTQPFTWSPIPQAQGYILTVGTAVFGADLVNSGALPGGQSSFNVPALPAGPTLHATLYAQVGGNWTSYQAVDFTAAPGQAALTFPLNGQAGVDPTRALTWLTIPQAQGYLVIVGTSQYGANLANSGVLPATQSSFATATLPPAITLYASVFTKVNGAFSRVQSVIFTAGPAKGILTNPVNGQLGVAVPTTFTWSTVAGAQSYILVVGTTVYGSNLVNSGVLPASQSSLSVPGLPHGRLLYATLLTLVDGTWTFQLVGFGT